MHKVKLQTAIAEKTRPLKTDGVGRYFVHLRGGSGSHPLLDCVDAVPRNRNRLYRPEPIGQDIAPIRYKFAPPVPRSPTLADHHKAPEPVLSCRFKYLIENLVAESVEFVPASIEAFGENFPYWAAHSMKCHDVIDRENSTFEVSRAGSFTWVDKLMLDAEKMAKIDKKERMLFRLGGSGVIWLWHEEIVQVVQAEQLIGIHFLPAEGYGQDAVFTQT